MKAKSQFLDLPLGMLELDEAGIVLHYDAAEVPGPGIQTADVVGLNFFTDIASITQLEDIKDRFNELLTGNGHSQKSSIFLLCAPPAVQIQLLPARAGAQTSAGRQAKVLVRIEEEH